MIPHGPPSHSPHSPQEPRLRHRDANLRKAKHVTAWTAVGGLVVTGGLAALAERSFSGQRRSVAPAETTVVDPAAGTATDPALTTPPAPGTALTLPPDTLPATTLSPVPVPVPVETVPAQTLPPETVPPTTAAPVVQTVPVTAPPAPPTTAPHKRTHTHPAVVVTSGGS